MQCPACKYDVMQRIGCTRNYDILFWCAVCGTTVADDSPHQPHSTPKLSLLFLEASREAAEEAKKAAREAVARTT